MDEKLIALISQTGFPIVVSCWFLWRLERRLVMMIIILTRIATKLSIPPAERDDA